MFFWGCMIDIQRGWLRGGRRKWLKLTHELNDHTLNGDGIVTSFILQIYLNIPFIYTLLYNPLDCKHTITQNLNGW